MPAGWRGLYWRIRGFSLERWLYRLLAEKWCGNDMVPLDHRTLHANEQGCEYVFSFLNDSFEIGIGYPNKWHCILRRETIHKFIWWYLRLWIFSEWFGLRRWLWYKLLFRSCDRQRKRMAQCSPQGSMPSGSTSEPA